MACGYVADGSGESGGCPRPARDVGDRCPLHAQPTDVSTAAVRAAICADLRSDDERRLEYTGVTLETLDLSGLALETDGIGTIRFVDSTVDGAVDLSGSTVEQPMVFDGCTIGLFDASDATFTRDVTVTESHVGHATSGTCLTFRRGTIGGRSRSTG